MANLGPASTNTSNTIATLSPLNTNAVSLPSIDFNDNRAVAIFRAVPLSGTGDIALAPIINSLSWCPSQIVICNALVNGVSGSVAAASIGVFTGPGSTGTTIRTAGVLTGQTTQPVVTVAATATTAVAQTAQTMYINNTVAVAGGTVDIFVLGFDLS